MWLFAASPQGQRRIAWVATLIAVAIQILLVGQHAIVRYQSFHADAFDLGNMDQAVWNTLHGNFFRFTNRGLDWEGPPTRLGIHVEPIILLIAPLYLMHSGPETLIVLQTIALGLGAIPLLSLGLRRLPGAPLVAAAIAITYLISPEVIGEALWDFHPVALATPLLILAVWALDQERYIWFIIAGALAAGTKEDVALALIPMGFYVLIWRRRAILGSAVVVLSILWTYLCFFVILPHFNGGVDGGNNYWYRYSWMGIDAKHAVETVLTHPWIPVVAVLSDPNRRGYLAMLLRTSGGLGLFAPVLLIGALPELAINVLSSHAEQYSGFFQYNAVLGATIPVAAVFGAAVVLQIVRHEVPPRAPLLERYSTLHHAPRASALVQTALRRVKFAMEYLGWWCKNHLQSLRFPRWLVAPALITWLIAAGIWNITTADARFINFWNVGAGPTPHQAAITRLLRTVPATATVAATDTIDPHLSDRYTIYLLPDPQSYQADYVVFDIADASLASQHLDTLIYDDMITSGHYEITGVVGNVVVLHRTKGPIPIPAAVGS